MKYFYLILSSFCLLALDVNAQTEALLDAFQYRSVGPSRGGRVTAVAGTAMLPGTFYMGATGGGVWKTEDYGTSWNNVSDGFFTTPSIGDISVAVKDPNVIYVGTGSDGIRSNVIIGKGMYKSLNAGKTWKHIGLDKAGQIGAVETHPDNYNIVYVAAQGSPFNANVERGVFKTENGGKSWNKVLYISDKTGFSDIELLPGNPEIVFAAAWKNERKPWTIISGGENSEGGMFKSVNGGKSWDKITKGLPEGLIGKIDFGICQSDSKVIYALVEAPGDEGGMYRSDDQGESFSQVSSFGGIRARPFYYTNVEVDPKNPDVLYVMATGYYKSIDGGKNWFRLRPPHGDNHDMWINPDNPDLFIQANDGGANVTHNGGKTWSTQMNQTTAELYQVEVDDQYPYWLYAGQQDNYSTIAVPSKAPYSVQDQSTGFLINTGGCETGPGVPKPGNHNIVYSNCKGRFSVFDKRTGIENSYNVGSRNMYGHNPNELKYRFQRVSPIHVSPHNADVVYHCSQFVHKTTDEGKTWEVISPDLTAFEPDKQVISGSPITRDITGEEFYSTIYAIQESKIDAGQIWVGSNDGPVHMTRDGGKNWSDVTPSSLPKGGRVDAVEPSSHNPAKAYVSVLRYQLGDWKPYIYKTTNYGKSWDLLTKNGSGFPQDQPTRVVREDPEKEGLLYAGTEFGMFISMDDGKSWQTFQQNMPVTPITDLKVFRNDLVISTMGRSFWILDNLTPLHQSAFANLGKNSHLFKPTNTIKYVSPKGRSNNYPRPAVFIDYYLGEEIKEPIAMIITNESGDTVQTYLSSENKKGVIEGSERDMSTEFITYTVNSNLSTKEGLHRFKWYMNRQGPWAESKGRRYQGGAMVAPGNYTVTLIVGDKEMSETFALKADPRVLESGITLADMKKQEAINKEIIDLRSETNRFLVKVKGMEKKLKGKEDQADKLAQVKQVLAALETAEGTYMKPMFISQLSYLSGLTGGADHVPGKEDTDRLAELKMELQKIKNMLTD